MAKPGPKTPEGRARAAANLRPFKPGQSGNPAGSRSAGRSVREHLNQLAAATAAEVAAVLADDAAPVARRAAAAAWFQATSTEVTTGGMPVSGPALDRIVNHTAGRPAVSAGDGGGDPPGIVIEFTTATKPPEDQEP